MPGSLSISDKGSLEYFLKQSRTASGGRSWASRPLIWAMAMRSTQIGGEGHVRYALTASAWGVVCFCSPPL